MNLNERETVNDATMFEYKEPEGTLFAEILPAITKWTWDGDERIADFRPALRVTTWVEGGIENRGLVSLRGRRYAINEVHQWRGDAAAGEWVSGYHLNNSVYEYLSREPVPSKSPVNAKLRAISCRVRDAFVAQHPTWLNASRRRGVVKLLQDALDRAASLRRAAEERDAEAARLVDLLDAMDA